MSHSSIIKEPEAWDRTTVTLPRRVLERLAKNMERVNSTRPFPERYTRDKFMVEIFEWACRELEREAASKRKATGS